MIPLLGFGIAIDYVVKFSRNLDKNVGLKNPVQMKIDSKLNIHELEFGTNAGKGKSNFCLFSSK
jgi:hypothetical protein